MLRRHYFGVSTGIWKAFLGSAPRLGSLGKNAEEL